MPDSTWVEGFNDSVKVNDAMNDPLWYGDDGHSFQEAVGRLLSPGYADNWEVFASTVHNSPTAKHATNFLSLEYIHNVLHVSCVHLASEASN